MKIEVVVGLEIIINIISVNCIVPKYLVDIESPDPKQRILKNSYSYTKFNTMLLSPVEVYHINKNNLKLSSKKHFLQTKYGYIKDIIDSAEVDKNAPVQDFDDYSGEDFNAEKGKTKHIKDDVNVSNAGRETFGELQETVKRNANENKEQEKYNLRNTRPNSIGTVNKLISKPAVKKHGTKANESVPKVRHTRNTNNIIEEENLGTTISGFKFTGRYSILNSDLAYKNIHA